MHPPCGSRYSGSLSTDSHFATEPELTWLTRRMMAVYQTRRIMKRMVSRSFCFYLVAQHSWSIAGFTFCAISALSLLGRLASVDDRHPREAGPDHSPTGPSNPQRTIRWLLSRQTATLSEEDDFDTNADETDTPETCHDAHSFVHPDEFPSKAGEMSYNTRPTSRFALDWIGFNGRVNKVADTCYGFWVGGALNVRHTACHLIPLPSYAFTFVRLVLRC